MTSVSPLDDDRAYAPETARRLRGRMTDDANDRNRRLVRHTACFTLPENAVLMTKVNVAGVSISSLMRTSVLEFSLQRIMRRPTLDQQLAVQLLGELGRLRTAFDSAVSAAGHAEHAAVEAALRDHEELRLVLFDALGIAP